MRLSSEAVLLLLHSCNLPVFITSVNSSLTGKWISFCCCSSSSCLFYPLYFLPFFHSTVLGWNMLKGLYFWAALMNKKANLTSCRLQDEVVAKIMGLSGRPSATDNRPPDKAVLSPSPLGSLPLVPTFPTFLDRLCNPRSPLLDSQDRQKNLWHNTCLQLNRKWVQLQ